MASNITFKKSSLSQCKLLPVRISDAIKLSSRRKFKISVKMAPFMNRHRGLAMDKFQYENSKFIPHSFGKRN